MAYNIGNMDTLVEVLESQQVQGTRGQKEYRFIHHSDVWAEVIRNMDEGVNDYNVSASDAVEIVCHKIPNMTTRWRIKIVGIEYNIIGIDPISRVSPVNRLTLRIID